MWWVGTATKEMKRLGLIGGIGTLAGVNLVWRMVEQCAKNGAHEDYEFPDFVYINVPARGTDSKGTTTFDTSCDILRSLNELNKLKCEVALILCNTCYLQFGAHQGMFAGKLLNMVEIACQHAKGKVAVLASRKSIEHDLFGKPLRERGCETVELTDDQQTLVDQLISDCMGYSNMDRAPIAMSELQAELNSFGVDQIIIGCTELSMIPSYCQGKAVIIDAGFRAIEEAVRLCRQ